MDVVNSQSLTHFDGYYHRFTKTGDYTWGVLVNKKNYTISVKPGGGNPTQYTISVTYANGVFTVDQQKLTLKANDYIL